MKLSSQETKDLHKYTKFFALKSAQVIIQSRLGEKITTPCKPNTQGTDWVKFNLNINDLPDVVSETKKVLNGDSLSPCYPLCVEISLRTSEGDQMALETWCLNLLPEQCDPINKNIPSVYNRMVLLLKSLMSVTRVTPAYKLSRRQGPDSYVMCYRIYTDQPIFHNLGDGYKSTRIGQICTPIGTIQFSVAYRTKMTISPTQTGKNNSIMVKSDHFNTNNSTRKNRNNDDISDLTKPMRPGPFADLKPKSKVEPQLPGVTRLLALSKPKSSSSLEKTTLEIESSENVKNLEDDTTNQKNEQNSKGSMTTSTTSRLSITTNLTEIDDEYWMKELSAPFATRGPVGELMHFYKQCKTSPPLQSPQQNPTPEEIKKMIEMFESQLPEYDALVQSFCESPDNN